MLKKDKGYKYTGEYILIQNKSYYMQIKFSPGFYYVIKYSKESGVNSMIKYHLLKCVFVRSHENKIPSAINVISEPNNRLKAKVACFHKEPLSM